MGPVHLVSNSTLSVNNSDKLDIYCEAHSVGQWIFAGLTVPAACVGLPASVWLLWALAQRQRSGLAINIYMLNVSVMDLLVNISIPVIILNGLFWRHDALSMAGMMSFCITTTGRPLFAASTCFDCYMAAVYPIGYMQMKTSRLRLVVCSLVWTMMFAYGVTYASNPDLLFTPLVMSPIALSLVPSLFFDVSVLHALRKPDPSGKRDVHPQKLKALRTITRNLVMTAVAYLPPVALYGFSELIPLERKEFFCEVGVPSYTLPFLFSAIMPQLYLKKLGLVSDVIGCGRA